MEEIWKDIKGYEGLYQISNTGKIKSIDRCYAHKGCNGGFYHKKEKILIPAYDKDKYLKVTLCKNGKKNSKSVHRLVAETFISNPNNLPQVNHKDENKQNNSVNNLEWCTVKYNTNYGTGIERSAKAKFKALLQYDLNMNLLKKWNSCKEAGETLKLNSKSISRCCLGKRKTAFGYIWKYYKDYMTEA